LKKVYHVCAAAFHQHLNEQKTRMQTASRERERERERERRRTKREERALQEGSRQKIKTAHACPSTTIEEKPPSHTDGPFGKQRQVERKEEREDHRAEGRPTADGKKGDKNFMRGVKKRQKECMNERKIRDGWMNEGGSEGTTDQRKEGRKEGRK